MKELSEIFSGPIKPGTLTKTYKTDPSSVSFMDLARGTILASQLMVTDKGSLKGLSLRKDWKTELNYFDFEEEQEETLQDLVGRLQCEIAKFFK